MFKMDLDPTGTFCYVKDYFSEKISIFYDFFVQYGFDNLLAIDVS